MHLKKENMNFLSKAVLVLKFVVWVYSETPSLAQSTNRIIIFFDHAFIYKIIVLPFLLHLMKSQTILPLMLF